ncbi:MAG: zinc ABC transporter substrate-binding protein [Limnochordaceae bacterium]|nr:zinc ABC transporter substrate-binding protein [Limnochordaceae bacterium]
MNEGKRIDGRRVTASFVIRCLIIAFAGVMLVAGAIPGTFAGRQTGPVPATAAAPGSASVPAGGVARSSTGSQGLIVTSTSITADLARQVAGDRWEVVSLMPLGADPHAFEPTPQDARLLARARLVVLVGAGLEPPAVTRLVRSAAVQAQVIELAPQLAVRWEGVSAHEGSSSQEESPSGHEPGTDAHEASHGDLDPHVWTSVPNAMRMVQQIASALERLDPAGKAAIAARAERYLAQLRELDAWVRRQVDRVPRERRVLVTNHETLHYFAREYGFTVVGAVIPSVSTLAEPTAAETAKLLDAIRRANVPAIFVEATVSPVLARRLAQEAGVRVVALYSDSLGPAGSGADSYAGYMRTNVTRIVEAMSDGR